MRRAALSILVLFGLAVSAFGQEAPAEESAEKPAKKSFSLEVGTGFAPLHFLHGTKWMIEEDLAAKGQGIDDSHTRSFTLSGLWRFAESWEAKLIAELAWLNCGVLQYPTFGTDPSGQPRYRIDYNQAEHVGRLNGGYCWATTAMMRYIWNPKDALQVYSEFGLGIIFDNVNCPYVLPGITFIGLRYCWNHIYIYAENTYSPAATLVHGGIGWRF